MVTTSLLLNTICSTFCMHSHQCGTNAPWHADRSTGRFLTTEISCLLLSFLLNFTSLLLRPWFSFYTGVLCALFLTLESSVCECLGSNVPHFLHYPHHFLPHMWLIETCIRQVLAVYRTCICFCLY